MFSTVSLYRWQDTWCVSLNHLSSGRSREHSGFAYEQRGWKAHPGGRFMGSGIEPRDRLELRAPVLDVGQGVEEALRVGVAQVVEDVGQGAVFHDPPGVHDAHGVAHVGHDPEVVRDHEHGHPGLLLELSNELEHLGLDGDVQGRGGLVGDQESGSQASAMAMTTRCCMPPRTGADTPTCAPPRDAHHLQHVHGQAQGFLVAHPAVDLHALGNLRAHGVDGVERGHGVLEDHGHLVAAHRPQLLEGHLEDILPLHEDLAGHNPARRRGHQVEDGQGGGGLSGPCFPHQAEGLAGGNGDVDAGDGVHDLVLDDVLHREVLDFQNVLLRIHRSAPASV